MRFNELGEEISTSGIINKVYSRNITDGIYFTNNTCQFCGNQMVLESRRLNGKDVGIRFICDNCGNISPIEHDINNHPLSRVKLKEFCDNFGMDIKEKIVELNKRRV